MINKIYRLYYYFADYIYDAYRYLVYSTTLSVNSYQKLEGRLMVYAHDIERALSFEKPRIKFGTDKINILLSLVHKYIKLNYPIDNFAFQSALNALNNYLTFHTTKGISLGVLGDKIKMLSKQGLNVNGNSITTLFAKKYFRSKSFADTITKRRSVRNFLNSPININKIEYAVKMALNSPSVCNRQSWHVYLLNNKKNIGRVLDIQRGNRGFREKIKNLLIITSDLNSFQGFNERNQCFIDGGIFSMSLLLSLHHSKLGACPMNWSYHFDEDIKIRKVLNIRKSENIIMLIAVGEIPTVVNVPSSRKKDISLTMKVLK